MARDTRNPADVRLDESARTRHCADPRPPLRERLRQLKESHPAAYEQARVHYEQVVAPALAKAADPLAEWVAWAAWLGSLSSPGRLVGIDAGGGSGPYSEPLPELLVLFIPDDTAAPVLVAAAPEAPSPAQQATIDLLVHRRLSL